MPSNEKRSPSFIIGSRHAGRSFLVSIKTYSAVLQMNVFGEMSDAHRKDLKVVSDCCDTPDKSWIALSELIEQNEDEKAMEILSQVDTTGQSFLERAFIHRSLAAMKMAQDVSSTILKQAEQLSEEQRFYVEIINRYCQSEINVWKEVAEYYA